MRTVTVDLDVLRDLVRATKQAGVQLSDLAPVIWQTAAGDPVFVARSLLREARTAVERLELDHPELRP